MLKIISFCLYGKQKIYNKGALYNSTMAKKYYPDFKVWIYFSSKEDIDIETYNKLIDMDNVKLINMNDISKSFGASIWRYIPAFTEKNLDIFITRDLDSCLDNKRDIYCVKEWIENKEKFHIIQDNPKHHKYPIMGGIWGVKGNLLYKYKDDFIQFMNDCTYNNKTFTNNVMSKKALMGASKTQKRGNIIDQYFLRLYVYPKIKNDSLIHYSSYSYKINNESKKLYESNQYKIIPNNIKDTFIGERTHTHILKF